MLAWIERRDESASLNEKKDPPRGIWTPLFGLMKQDRGGVVTYAKT